MTDDLLAGTRWVTDGGLETDLIFHHDVDLPEFASYPLLDDETTADLLRTYYRAYVAIARAAGAGVLLETPTWRANRDWGARLGHDAAALDSANRAAVELVRQVVDEGTVDSALVSGCVGPRGDGYLAGGTDPREVALVSGCVGPRGDGYLAGGTDPREAEAYHRAQVESLAAAGADLVHAMTMTGTAEPIGVVRAARSAGIPVAVSFTVETDGRLPDGTSLSAALCRVPDEAPADWYGVNCAHPTHLAPALDDGEWQGLVTWFRPNASTMSHAELDEAAVLDDGDVDLLAGSTTSLADRLPSLAVLGGCCGTDSRHVAALWGVAPPA